MCQKSWSSPKHIGADESIMIPVIWGIIRIVNIRSDRASKIIKSLYDLNQVCWYIDPNYTQNSVRQQSWADADTLSVVVFPVSLDEELLLLMWAQNVWAIWILVFSLGSVFSVQLCLPHALRIINPADGLCWCDVMLVCRKLEMNSEGRGRTSGDLLTASLILSM